MAWPADAAGVGKIEERAMHEWLFFTVPAVNNHTIDMPPPFHFMEGGRHINDGQAVHT